MKDKKAVEAEALSRLSDKELKALADQDIDIDTPLSQAFVAKRMIDNRMLDRIENHLYREIQELGNKIYELYHIFGIFNDSWYFRQSTFFKVSSFIVGTIIVGIIINLASDYIAKFWLHW